MRIITLALLTLLLSSPVAGQWLNERTQGITRSPDGKPNLTAPPPRTPQGTPDLSGLWIAPFHPAYLANVAADLKPSDVQPWARALFESRVVDLTDDDPGTVGCQPLGPRSITGGGPARMAKIVQTPSLILVLFEDLTYRQIFMDGRDLPKNPYPSFMGYSVGRWESDDLIVDSIGFNADTWLDFGGHPHSESLRISERYRRTDFGHVRREITIVDPEVFTKPIAVASDLRLAADTELLEYVCTQTPKDRFPLAGTTAEERAPRVPPQLLARYTGVYEIEGPAAGFGIRRLTVTRLDSQLFIDFDGTGNIPLVPVSETMFSPRLQGTYEFITDGHPSATHVLIHSVEGAFKAIRRPDGARQ